MSALRLSWTVAGSSAMGNGASVSGGINAAGYVSPSATSDLIGLVPLNPATLTPPGYVDTVTQYGADQLTFAFSQGEYTAFGATPQTFVQNLLGSASPLLQFAATSQTMYNTVNIQNDLFAVNAQMMEISSYGNPFSAPYSGLGFSAGNTSFGPAFSSSSTPAFNNTTLVTSVSHGLDGTQASGLDTGLNGLNPVGTGGDAVSESVSNVSNGAPSLLGQGSGSGIQSAIDHGAGSAGTVATVTAAPSTNPAAVTASDGSVGHIDQAASSQGTQITTGATLPSFSMESLNVKSMTSDPFAHYSHLGQGDQAVASVTTADHAPSVVTDLVNAATGLAGGGIDLGFHFAALTDSHESPAVGVSIDPVSHALQHVAITGAHLA